MTRVIEKLDFNLAEVALLTAKRLGCKMRCHQCSEAVGWRDAAVEQIGYTDWHCICNKCESGVSSHEFEDVGDVGPLSFVGLKPTKAMKAMKAKKAMKAMKAKKAMKAMKK